MPRKTKVQLEAEAAAAVEVEVDPFAGFALVEDTGSVYVDPAKTAAWVAALPLAEGKVLYVSQDGISTKSLGRNAAYRYRKAVAETLGVDEAAIGTKTVERDGKVLFGLRIVSGTAAATPDEAGGPDA